MSSLLNDLHWTSLQQERRTLIDLTLFYKIQYNLDLPFPKEISRNISYTGKSLFGISRLSLQVIVFWPLHTLMEQSLMSSDAVLTALKLKLEHCLSIKLVFLYPLSLISLTTYYLPVD